MYKVIWEFKQLKSGSCRRYYTKAKKMEEIFKNQQEAYAFYNELIVDQNDKYYPKFNIKIEKIGE